MLRMQKIGKFDEMYRKLVTSNAELKLIILNRVKWFRNNPNDTRLNNHALTKQLKGKWAFSITDDIRIVYEWLGKTTVRLLAIGGHKRVYTKGSSSVNQPS